MIDELVYLVISLFNYISSNNINKQVSIMSDNNSEEKIRVTIILHSIIAK